MSTQRNLMVLACAAGMVWLCSMDGDAAGGAGSDLAGVWAVTETIAGSTCPGVDVGDRKGMLLTVDQVVSGTLSVSVVGSTSCRSYSGRVDGSDVTLVCQAGSTTSTIGGSVSNGTLSGSHTIIALKDSQLAPDTACVIKKSLTATRL